MSVSLPFWTLSGSSELVASRPARSRSARSASVQLQSGPSQIRLSFRSRTVAGPKWEPSHFHAESCCEAPCSALGSLQHTRTTRTPGIDTYTKNRSSVQAAVDQLATVTNPAAADGQA